MTKSPWPLTPLHVLADVLVSNVDKKTFPGETPVRLCNYSDVYSNDYVTNSLQFMKASAGKAEISRFALSRGDVVITKDSESPDDIGVPAVVTEDVELLVCGYHLAILRPRNGAIDPIY